MKSFKKLLATAMTLTMLVSALPFSVNAQQVDDVKVNESFITESAQTKQNDDFSGYGLGNIIMDEENVDNVKVISSPSDYFEITHTSDNSKADITTTAAATMPDSVDNSQSAYFPEIGSQGSLNSCVPFAASYYQFTYEINKSRGVTTTAQNTFSTKWAFNFLCHGTGSGTNYALVYGILKQHGCPTTKTLPYDAKDYLSWSTDEKVWREAMRYRLKDYQLFDDIGKDLKEITSPDDPDLLAIKASLANGDILTYSTYINSWASGTKKIKTNASAPENNKFANEKYLNSLPSTDGGHRMTIVGYNDNLWCDINGNNVVDDGEMGALKVANSWGDDWGNKGFMWVAYDALNSSSCVEGVTDPSGRTRAMTEITRIDVTVNEGNDIYAKLTVNTSDRSRFYAIFSASLHGSEYSRYLLEDAKYPGTTDKHAFDGTTTACDATFLYPLDDLSPTLTLDNFEDHDFSVTIKDGVSDTATVVVKKVSLVNEYTGKEYKVSSNLPVTLDKGEWNANLKENTTKNAVVYYIGFDEPNLHYKQSGNTFTKVKMEKNDERHGHQYKYVVEDITSDIAIYFSDDKGNVDNNAGSYYYAKDGLNYYFTKGQRDELKISDLEVTHGTPDVGKRCSLGFNTTGGYEPYQYKYTLEDLSTGTIKTINYNVKYENNPFKFEKETTYKITVEAMDYAKQTTQSSIVVEVTDQPFVIDSLAADKQNGIVSKELVFTSTTAYEGLMSGPHKPQTRFVIKDSNGKVWCDDTVLYKTSNYLINSTTTEINFTPQKAGEYTITASSTDWNKEYAEKTTQFTVYDMIYGDADGSGIVNIIDATTIQRSLVGLVDETGYYKEMSDCDGSVGLNVLDATAIQRYLVSSSNFGNTGKVIEYTPTTEPDDPVDPKPDDPVDPTPVTGNKVTFTNSLNWSGTIYCYYWSDANTQMTTWPGKAMTKSGTNEYGETLYTFDVPKGATYIIFTNGSSQTVDITYNGGVVKYYAESSKTGNGHNVGTW